MERQRLVRCPGSLDTRGSWLGWPLESRRLGEWRGAIPKATDFLLGFGIR